MNKTKTTTLIIFAVLLFFQFSSTLVTTFLDYVEATTTQIWVFAVVIGIIALIKGNMAGWGISNRKTAIIVIIAGFLFAVLMALPWVMLYHYFL